MFFNKPARIKRSYIIIVWNKIFSICLYSTVSSIIKVLLFVGKCDPGAFRERAENLVWLLVFLMSASLHKKSNYVAGFYAPETLHL